MGNNNDKSKNIIIAILIIMIIALAGVHVYDKFIVKKESEKSATSTTDNNQQTNVIDAKTEEKLLYSAVKVNFNSNDTATINLGNNQVTLSNKMNDDQGQFKFNSKLLFETSMTKMVDEVYTFNDILLVVTSGTDIRSSVLYIYDKNGNKLKEVYELDSVDKGMVITQLESENENEIKYLSFNNNKIIMNGWRINNGNTIVVNGKDVNYCDKNALNKNNVTGDYVIEARYELEYLGNNTFSQLKIIEGSQSTFDQQEFIKNYSKTCNQ